LRPSQENFSDGLTEEVLNSLARILELARSGTAALDRGDMVLAAGRTERE
jgi:TolB-like protein